MDLTDVRIMVDTNVWVDNFYGARRGTTKSSKSLDLAAGRGAQLLYAATSAKDVFYLVVKQLKNEARQCSGCITSQEAKAIEMVAAACLESMDNCATAVGIDSSDIWLARKYCKVHMDFEDCLIMAAAKRAKADYVLTCDKDFLRHAIVPTLSPDDFITLMEA